MEMRWLHEHGLISNWWEYEALPLTVLEDARLAIEAEARWLKEAKSRRGRR